MALESNREAMIRVNGLSKTYGKEGGKTIALNDVSLEIHEGEFLAILGPSGSGKSTLLHLLGGMDRPDGGQILLRGEDIANYNEAKRNRYRRDHVAFVFQSYNLLNELTLLQNILLAPGSGNRQKALQTLASLGLEGKENSFPKQLSGGEQQRGAIARALNKDFDLLLCDEPTGALDEASGKAVLDCILDLHKQGKTIVLVTHNTDIASFADRVITLRDGKIANIATKGAD